MSEHGFTFTSDNVFGLPYSSVKGKPYITVSAKGLANGTSNIPNDGADFGPDTLQADGSPTQTSGIQEAGDYANSNGGGIVKLSLGLFLIDTTIDGSNWNGVTIEGSGSIITSSVVSQLTTAGGTVVAPSSSWSPSVSFIYNVPGQPNGTYYPLIYVIGNGANSSVNTGTNLQFKNMMLSGAIGGETGGTATAAGLYISGVWNCLVEHVDTQNCTIGHYASLNGPSGNSWWISNSTHEAASIMGGYYHIDEGLIYALNAEGCTNSFDIGGNGADIPMTAIGLSWDAGPLFTNYINCIGCFNDAATNGAVVYVAYNSIFTGCIFTQRDNRNGDPIIKQAGGLTPYSILFQSCTFIPSTDTSNPTPLISGEYNATGFNPYTIKVKDCILTPPPSSVWNSNLLAGAYSVSGYMLGIILENLYGVTLPPPTTPSVPASGTALQNTNPYKVSFFLNGGTVTEIQITRGGTAYTVLSNSTGISLSSFPVTLEPGDSITLTYTTAPTWTDWMPD